VAVRAVADGGFAALIGRDRLPVGVVLVSLLAAVFWGAAHALSPGHGKSIIAAYLVGARGTRRDAIVLGLTVTVTHTVGVFALGLITLSLSQFVLPEDLYPWLNLISALLVVTVGLGVLSWRLRAWRRPQHAHHHHHHGHHHHHHDHDRPGGLRSLLGVGVSGGLIPCPTALVVLLAAISLHRIGYGLVLILAFSGGLAAAMTGIGFLAVSAKRAFDRVDLEAGAIRILPAVSALVILGLGVAMTVRALPHVT
jgi:ABC-type nickel/cobalt efflux system permease component RcnA